MRYEFATAQRIVVGPGSSAELADSVRTLGGRALLALGSGMAARGGPAAVLGPGAALDDLAPALRELVAELNIPQLAAYDLTAADVPEKASSTRANPIDLEQGEIEEAIYAAL
jgi:alcohol dehydrogenase class IV